MAPTYAGEPNRQRQSGALLYTAIWGTVDEAGVLGRRDPAGQFGTAVTPVVFLMAYPAATRQLAGAPATAFMAAKTPGLGRPRS